MPMEFINQNILLITLVLFSGFALIWPLLRGGSAKGLSPVQATQLINQEDAQIIDVRSAEEFAAGHLPNAKNIPLEKLTERVGEIEKFKDQAILVCCMAGMRSAKGCGQLSKLGFTKVQSLDGGVDAWQQAGYPLKKGASRK